MSKASIVEDVQKRCVKGELEITKKDVGIVLDALFDHFTDLLCEGEPARYANFGVFTRAYRKARTGKNPRTSEPVHIPAMHVVKFKPAKALKEKLNQ